ncbi:helix-turn-helix domain-containing protein [Nocardia sp. CA-084685]|uniref:helix-turn-helix domain-containing protein n=1 Tax=Nocardia sp. CA-084685 TaxID=3239970 RepID=UPI003D966559
MDSSGKAAQALALRLRIVLACADSLSNSEVSRRWGVSLPTEGKWRSRFVARRLDGLGDEPRPGGACHETVLVRDDIIYLMYSSTTEFVLGRASRVCSTPRSSPGCRCR